MNYPVNLIELREITNGDPDLEKELFDVFIDTTDSCLQKLEASQTQGMEDLWKRQAHALKGAALNLGAERLGALCKEAQDSSDIPLTSKTNLLTAIWEEYARVKNYLRSLHNSG